MRRLVILGIVLGLASAIVIFLRPYVWFRNPGGRVTVDGHEAANGRIYRISRGDVDVYLGTPYNRSYIVDPSVREVGMSARDTILDTRFFLVYPAAPLWRVNLSATGKIDSHHTPDLQLSEREAQFFDPNGHLVRLTW